ncbi:MAG: tRNA epoxyqueuosine(34) reductase QueG [Bacteroidetes bacterium]|jgi:epoxyqueuosine reductase|nr:tRNA epoxyqueuosine(34) reductase QueG [Bacteroidota bacterium]
MATLSDRLREEARRLGCLSLGIAHAEALDPEGARLRAWIDRGFQASMGWMARRAAERSDPALVLPSVRSIVVVAVNYFAGHRHSSASESAKLSRYAWGDDYHDIVLQKVERLAELIRHELPGAETRCYADTGPVMEKAWAARAGVGWIGKHTNVITRDAGSWVFLGSLLTSAELKPDEPAVDHCGSCRACLDACPTEAFPQPYVLDASKCISYLTIEHRGPLPAEAANQLNGWVFGCDICQEVCPWNRFEQPSDEPGFQPRPGNEAPLLVDLERLTETGFLDRFKGSPVVRPRYHGFMRNVKALLESLGKSGHHKH